jgi:hypothetical protein
VPVTSTEKNNLATKYGTDCLYAALFTTAPSGSTPGTEVSGGSYARVAVSWGAPAAGVMSATCSFNVPATTIAGAGLYTAATGGTYLDGGALTSQSVVAGTYSLTLQLTVS